jgi:phage major head subunit gpT-like protein
MAAISASFGDLLTPIFRKVVQEQYDSIPSTIPELYNMQTSKKSAEQTSSVGAFSDFGTMTGGLVPYDEVYQGYNKTFTHVVYVKGFSTSRELYDDDLYGIMKKKPFGMGVAAKRTREKKGAELFNNAWTTEDADGDGAEWCASDHGSNADATYSESNEGTTALSATAVAATKILMEEFTDDRGNLINVMPDTLLVPNATIADTAYEIINSKGKVDTANNNLNIHYGKYKLIIWKYLSDTNNWYMIDSKYLQMSCHWFDRKPLEFFQDKDSDTLLAKHVGYMRYVNGQDDWRGIYGQLVT